MALGGLFRRGKLTADMTQLPGAGKRGTLQLVIGLDFGTAFTKVVIAESRRRYAVPFPAAGQSDYLLPCILREGTNGICALGPGTGQVHADLKMKIIEGEASEKHHVLATAFLAMVLRQARHWFLQQHRATYEGQRLDWHVNVGLPTENYHDEELITVYHRLVMAAWNLSVTPGEITLPAARQALRGTLAPPSEERCIHPDKVALFPEFVAQLTGYVRSPLRRDDLHMLMDVGAGTLDMTMFNVYRDPKNYSNSYPIFTKAVRPLGTNYLTRHRAKSLGRLWDEMFDAQAPIPPQCDVADKLGVAFKVVEECDKSFQLEVRKLMAEQLRDTKGFRYPTSPRWREGVPVFLCGGGGEVDVYYDIIYSISRKQNHSFPVKYFALPLPEDLEGNDLDEIMFHRLSVAYGLSFDAFDIGEIIKSNEVEDFIVETDNDPYGDQFVSKDME